MTLSDVIEKWGITPSQANELYELIGDVSSCFRYACLLSNGLQMRDIRWLFKSNLFYVFKSDDWPVLAHFVRHVAEKSRSDPADVLSGLLSYVNCEFRSDNMALAISYLTDLRDRVDNEKVKEVPAVRYIRATEAATAEEEEG